MKKRLLLVSAALLLFNCSIFAQLYVGDSKNHVKNWMSIRAGKYDKASTKIETDSSYTYLFRGNNVKPTDVYFLFGKNGKCYFEKWAFNCDTCYNGLVKYIIDKGRYKWKKSEGNTYLSKSSKQLKLNLDITKFTLTITQLHMREEDYLVLYNKVSK